jgi:regulator of protease activity HflC (stomatin/prohibitin superfamily)
VSKYDDLSEGEMVWWWVKRVGGVVVLLVAAGMAGCPKYDVWTAEQEGLAIKAKADGSRQALVAQAQAELDAAEKRAKAVAIMGEAAKKFPEYRTQEFIGAFAEALKEGNINQIIYVPTEANIPVLEADGRRFEAAAK